MIEWMEYPIGLANLDEEVTITWSDGSQDVVPGHDGDGETIYQLPNLMEEIFRVRFYHLWESHEAKFADEYPGLYRYKNGVLVLRASSEERFQNAFICKERDPALCLLSWMNGEVAHWMLEPKWKPEGCTDNHYASIREFLAVIGSGLLNDFPPIVFGSGDDDDATNSWFKEIGSVKVETGWWYPDDPNGPDFGYPAALFVPKTYEETPTIESVSELAAAIGLNHKLDDEVWKRLNVGVTENSDVLKILHVMDERSKNAIFEIAKDLKPIFEQRWQDMY
jgi:hypothetical protein